MISNIMLRKQPYIHRTGFHLVSKIVPFSLYFCADCFQFKNLLDRIQNSTTIMRLNDFQHQQQKDTALKCFHRGEKKDQNNVCFKSNKKQNEQHRRDVLLYIFSRF